MISKKSLEEASLLCAQSHERTNPCDVCEAIAKRLDAIKDETWALAESRTRKRIVSWLNAAGREADATRISQLVPDPRPGDE